MSFELKILDNSLTNLYDAFIIKNEASLFYHTRKYKSLLEDILENSSSNYLLAMSDGEILAAFPLFIKQSHIGTVVNSLPFFGSHGSIIADRKATEFVHNALIKEYIHLCKNLKVLSGTIITNLVEENRNLIAQVQPDYIDSRTGQVTFLPLARGEGTFEAELMETFHPQTRNAVRKGLKSNLSFQVDYDPLIMHDLYQIHCVNINKLNGIPKPWKMFEMIPRIFERGTDYDIFSARNRDGYLVSGLLVFYFKNWVEYFLPATLEEYRKTQPLSAIIFNAMKHAIREKGSQRWNWGGTWESQKSVHFFKSRWGAIDFPYYYYTTEFSDTRLRDSYTRTELLTSFEHFYTIPFSQLRL